MSAVGARGARAPAEGRAEGLAWCALREDPLAAWSALASAARGATAFHDPRWARALARAFPAWSPRPLALEFADGNRAVLPFLRRAPAAVGALAHLDSLPPGVYGGALFERAPRAAHWAGLHQALARHGSFTLYGNPFLETPPAPPAPGLLRARQTTLVLDLAPGFDAVWSGFRGNHRRGVRDARAAGFEIAQAAGPADVDAYHAVYRDALARWGRRRAFGHFPARFFHALREVAGDDGWARLWLVRAGGEVVGGAWILSSADHADYWHACARRDVLARFPMHLLVAEAVRRACEEGRRWFDLNPSGGLEGVELFKRGFRPRELSFELVSRSGPGVRAYRRLRRWGEKYLGRCPL